MFENAEERDPRHDRAPKGLRPLFVLITLTEILTIAALFWFGRHFI